MRFSRKREESPHRVYLDYASGALVSGSGNPGGLHKEGVTAKKILEEARTRTAKVLGVRPREIIFTGSGTEGNNLAISGIIGGKRPLAGKGRTLKMPPASPAGRQGPTLRSQDLEEPPHIVTTNIEHASVLETCKHLEKSEQAEVTYVPVGKNGIVDPRKIEKALRPNTILVSVMYANNEIGTIQPIREIAKIIRRFRKSITPPNPPLNKGRAKGGVYFHTDAVQAANYLDIRPDYLGVDLLTLNGSKIYGPRGTGILYARAGTPLEPIMFGGDQEFGLRPGTENVAAVAGFAKALEKAAEMREGENARLVKLRDYFLEALRKMGYLTPRRAEVGPRNFLRSDLGIRAAKLILNGDPAQRLPNNINISVPGVESEMLVLELDARGIAVSSRSACKSGDEEESHVILAIRQGRTLGIKKGSTLKRPKEEGSLRISLGRATTKADIDYLLKSLRAVLAKLTRQKLWY